MISGLYLFIILIALVIIIAIVWRFASRRHAIPCPVWMSSLLGYPVFPGSECTDTYNNPEARCKTGNEGAGCRVRSWPSHPAHR